MVNSIINRAGQEPKDEHICRHIWVIAAPNGPQSRGKCRRCGMTKEFLNTPVEMIIK